MAALITTGTKMVSCEKVGEIVARVEVSRSKTEQYLKFGTGGDGV